MDIFGNIGRHVMAPLPVKAGRLPTFYPSAASCASAIDSQVIGTCMRSQWYRCKGYSETNPPGLYNQFIFAAGNMWENWLTEQFKQMGVWLGNNIKWSIPEKYISGEIDILIRDTDGTPAIVESKTFSSSNYQALKDLQGSKAFRGNAEKKPKPKDQNLLQSFLYLGYFGRENNGDVKKVYLTYFDRACGSPDNNKQFVIEAVPNGDSVSPRITTTDAYGQEYSYTDTRITLDGIYARYDLLMDHLKQNQMPLPDYEHKYSEEKIIRLYQAGEIAKTKFEKWEGNKEANPIGDWNCGWCGYKDLCAAQKATDGHN